MGADQIAEIGIVIPNKIVFNHIISHRISMALFHIIRLYPQWVKLIRR